MDYNLNIISIITVRFAQSFMNIYLISKKIENFKFLVLKASNRTYLFQHHSARAGFIYLVKDTGEGAELIRESSKTPSIAHIIDTPGNLDYLN
jgi:hypothetical protein